MQRLCCGPYAVLFRQRHRRRPQIRRNPLAAFATTAPVFKLLSCFFDFARNRYSRSFTHQHASFSKWHTEAINLGYKDSRTPAERTQEIHADVNGLDPDGNTPL